MNSTLPNDTIPVEHNDPVNARILAISEDKIAGFVREPFLENAERADVPVAHTEEVWATAPEFELRAAHPSGPSGRVRIAFGEHAPDPFGWSKDFQPLGYLST